MEFILVHIDTLAKAIDEGLNISDATVINDPFMVGVCDIQYVLGHTIALRDGEEIIVVESAEEIYEQLKAK